MGDGHDEEAAPEADRPASSGIEGLDAILHGGFPRGDVHVVQGGPGTGKSTLALQYLLTGLRAGERGLYVTLSQTRRGLETIARSHGFSLDGLAVHELSAADPLVTSQTVLHTAEVELGELTAELRRVVEQVGPRRVVVDSIGALALLAGSRTRCHREIVLLRQFLIEHACTTLLLRDDRSGHVIEDDLDVLAGAVVCLDQIAPDYGEVQRTLRVVKVRGVLFESGHHNFRIRTGGLLVYPRPRSPAHEYSEFKLVQSGIASLDAQLGGGLEKGTTALFVGPPGSGKSTLASVYAHAVARGGERASLFLFEERPETFKARAHGVGIDLQPFVSAGGIDIEKIDTSQISPGEFGQRVRAAVEEQGAKLVLIDSLTGYFNTMGNRPMLVPQMHDLLTFLSRHGALTLLTVSQESFMTVGPRAFVDISYLSDSIILLRMFEADSAVRRCVTVLKKRQGAHESTIRELFIQPGEVQVGEEPLAHLRHILGGEPDPADDAPGGGPG